MAARGQCKPLGQCACVRACVRVRVRWGVGRIPGPFSPPTHLQFLRQPAHLTGAPTVTAPPGTRPHRATDPFGNHCSLTGEQQGQPRGANPEARGR